MEPRDRVGYAGVQLLPARARDAGKQCLTNKFMSEGERPLWSLGARDDYSHPLRLLDDGEKFVNVALADRSQKLKAETAPEHRGGCQHPLFILVELRQAAADDQPHALWDVALVDLNVSEELAGLIKDFPLFDQMPIHLLDEEWISLAFLENDAHQTFWSLTRRNPFNICATASLDKPPSLSGWIPSELTLPEF
jgi:hypothetical protein